MQGRFQPKALTARLKDKSGYWYILVNRSPYGYDTPKWVSTGLPLKNNQRRARNLIPEAIEYVQMACEAEKKGISFQVTFDEYQENKKLVSAAPSTQGVLTVITSADQDAPPIIKRKKLDAKGLPPEEIQFTYYLEKWLKKAKRNVRPNSYKTYVDTVNAHVRPYFQGWNILDIDRWVLEDYFAERLDNEDEDKNLAPSYLKKHKTCISQTFETAMELTEKYQLIPQNPTKSVTLPTTRPKVQFYTPEQIAVLMPHVVETRIEAPSILSLLLGMRRSEVLGLRWNSFDFINKFIMVNHTVVRVGGKDRAFDETKNETSTRAMPMLPLVEKYLLHLKARQEQDRKLCAKGYKGDLKKGYVCVREDGERLRADYVTKAFTDTIRDNGLPKLTFHGLRHSTASYLAFEGCSLREIGEYLGHSNIQSTACYAHLQFRSKEKMGTKVNQGFSKAIESALGVGFQGIPKELMGENTAHLAKEWNGLQGA